MELGRVLGPDAVLDLDDPARLLALTVTVRDGRIAGYDVIAEPARLRDLDLAMLGEPAENHDGGRRGRA